MNEPYTEKTEVMIGYGIGQVREKGGHVATPATTRLAKITSTEAEGVVNVALHPVLFDAFVAWLDSRGCDLSPPIPLNDEGETFRVVSPRLQAPDNGFDVIGWRR